MNGFIDLLEEYKVDNQDEKIILDFKEKINQPAEYRAHLANFDFTEKWFCKLDELLIQLGYRALDADIKYITDWLSNKLHDVNINKMNIGNTIDKFYNLINLLASEENPYIYYQPTVEIVEYFIYQIPDKISWKWFSRNKSNIAVCYCLEHLDCISWGNFSRNESDIAVNYLIENFNKIHWYNFSRNENPIAVSCLIEHPDKIKWEYFSQNSTDLATSYCLKHLDKIDWQKFSLNETDIAVNYLMAHPNKISWDRFSQNASDIAVSYLIENPDDIHWRSFSRNINNMAVEYFIRKYPLAYEDCVDKNKNINMVKHCLKNNIYTYHEYVLTEEEIWKYKIKAFNQLNWLPMSRIII